MSPGPVLPSLLSGAMASLSQAPALPASPSVRVLCRTPAQARACAGLPWLDEVGLDFLEVQGLAEVVRELQAAGKRVVVATPRVLKPAEERLRAFFRRLRPDALLVRSIGLLHQLTDPGLLAAEPAAERSIPLPALHGDFSLNAANSLSAALLLGGRALARLTPAHDLSAAQLAALARAVGPAAAARLELVAHAHLPTFHTEHCLFARHLSTGSSYKDCGHPCERHALALRAADGAQHAVLADAGCRNTVFNAQPQSLAAGPMGAADATFAELAAAGVGHLRIELLNEGPEAVGPLLEAYRTLAGGRAPKPERAAAYATLRRLCGELERGSLQERAEEPKRALKETAAALKAKAR